MAEARLEGGVPQTAGWFVLNARDAPWLHNELRSVAKFGGEGSARYPVEQAAIRHGAGVEAEGDPPYARFSEPRPGPPPAGI